MQLPIVLTALLLLSLGDPALACEPRLQRIAQVKLSPPPAPPPLPFRYIGRVVQDGRVEVLLLRGAQHFSVAAGGALGSQYRVEKIGESEILILYLPLNVQQVLPL
jgi:hypothetical protein